MSLSSEKVIASKLLEVGAVKLSVDQPFTWASGWHSPIYCDNRKVLSFPFVRDFVKSEICDVIFESFPEADLIAGVATAGIPWGAMAADQLKLPYIYVRSKPKNHGLGNQIEGAFEKGQKTVVMEDLISTGKSSLEAVEALRAQGLDVIAVVSIFNYGFQTAVDAFAEAKVPFISLTNYNALIDLAVENGTVPEAAKETLNAWRHNPSEWGK